MTWVAVAIGGSAIVGGVVASNSADKAANAQETSANKSIAAQNEQLRLTRAENAPFLDTGTKSNTRLASLLGLGPQGGTGPLTEQQVQQIYQRYMGRPVQADEMKSLMATNTSAAQVEKSVASSPEYVYHIGPKGNVSPVTTQLFADESAAPSADAGSLIKKFSASDLNADPVYQSGLQFGLDRGTQGINARATASGMYDSGATLKALTQFGNDYGSTKANESYNRFTNDQGNIYNKLAGVSGTGQVATNQVASAGTSAANNISNDLTGAGNARAAGIVGGANAWGNAASGASGAAMNYQNNQRFQALFGNGNNGYYGSSGPYNQSQAVKNSSMYGY